MENKQTSKNKIQCSKKLNIGLFIDTWFPMVDGVVNVVDNYAKRLTKFANVTVFTVAPRDKNYKNNFTYKVVRSSKLELPGLDYDLAMPAFDQNFQNELKKSKLDIVHIHSPFSIGKAGLNYAKKHKIPCIATNHSQFKQDFFKATKSPALTEIMLATIMKVFNACDENWSVNSAVAKVYDDYGLKKPAIVVNNATDMELLQDDKFLANLRAKHNIDNGTKVLLFVGRICELKNIYFILDSLVELKKQGIKFKMLYVGTGQDKEALQKKIDEQNMNDCVELVGRVMDRKILAGYYNIANLFLFPSLYDCASLVQIEAASQKTPTLFLKNAVTADGITDNINGYFSENDPIKYAKRILEIFEDNETYKKVCENCYETVYVHWNKRVRYAYERYLKLIKQKKSRNKAIAKKSQYTKTIKSIQKQQQSAKKEKNKRMAKIIQRAKDYPKTTKLINSRLNNQD